jgi:hypothetical protein
VQANGAEVMRSIWTPPAVRPQLGGLCLGAHITGLVAVQALISSNYAKIMLGNLELSTPDEGLSLGVRYWRSCRGTDDQVVLPDGDARFRPLRLHDRIGRLRSLARPGRAGAHAVSAPTGRVPSTLERPGSLTGSVSGVRFTIPGRAACGWQQGVPAVFCAPRAARIGVVAREPSAGRMRRYVGRLLVCHQLVEAAAAHVAHTAHRRATSRRCDRFLTNHCGTRLS